MKKLMILACLILITTSFSFADDVTPKLSTAAIKKAEKITEIDNKLTQLKEDLEKIKTNTTLNEAEKKTAIKQLQTRIDIYSRQKAVLK